ncbi:MAG: hypothetical protein EON95_16380 [Caulobacteraceae bacterium]|nr:MAG: hypothetical protein EON95_16380 [Caulobacteraceae bacterium]
MHATARDLPQPVIFIGEAGARLEVPPDTTAALVCASANCLSVWARPAFEGPLRIEVQPMGFSPAIDMIEVFTGLLPCPSSLMSITDTGGAEILTFSIRRVQALLQLFVDDAANPARLLILAERR